MKSSLGDHFVVLSKEHGQKLFPGPRYALHSAIEELTVHSACLVILTPGKYEARTLANGPEISGCIKVFGAKLDTAEERIAALEAALREAEHKLSALKKAFGDDERTIDELAAERLKPIVAALCGDAKDAVGEP